ncbi:hypothetical protein B0H11DRAFT_2099928, partial [Mycena galericulata]
ISMHRTFEIPEIVALIFAELKGPCSIRTGGHRRDFAALARTCKSFQGPALDLLWSEQNTLTNVLRCLPRHLWEEKGDGQLRFLDGIKAADWEIPLSYSRRVQKLSLIWFSSVPSGYPHFPTADVLHTVATYLPPGYLFPNIRDVSWNPPEDSLFPYIGLFLGPKITAARLAFSRNTSNVSLLPQLALPYPAIESLVINSVVENSELFRRTASRTVLLLKNIQTLWLDKLDRDALEYLSQLPDLGTLILDLPDLQDLGPRSPRMRSVERPFPALRTLKFFNTTIEFALEFLDFWPVCFLRDFYIGTEVPATKFITGQIYVTVARQISPATLETLHIQHAEDGEMPTPPAARVADYVVGGPEIAPLFYFRNLTELTLEAPVGFDIDDTTALDMASAWPNLKQFRLGSATDLWYPSRMTLHGLCAFAKHCRNLRSLAISMDATTVPSPDAQISQSALLHLDVGPSSIVDPPTVTRFMSSLFPSLRTIKTLNDWRWQEEEPLQGEEEQEALERGYYAKWKQVEGFVPMVAAVRREEQLRARMAGG